VVARDRGVGADNLFGCAIGLLDVGANGDVLTDRKAEDAAFGGELEAVAGGE
jgi:hypothetical protein